MQSIIIYGGEKSSRIYKLDEVLKEYGEVKNHDKMVIVEGSISKVREAIRFLHVRPEEGDLKVVVFSDAGLLNVESQNALLKTLEEPPSYGLIVLSVNSLADLLDTVVSRCIALYSGNDSESFSESDLLTVNDVERLLLSDIGFRIDWINKHKKDMRDKDFESIFFKTLEHVLEKKVRDVGVDRNILNKINKLFTAKKNVKKGGSVALNIEALLFEI